MSADAPQLYRVDLSARAHAGILRLADAARDRGDGPGFLAALKEFYRRLRIYPQFGDPLADLVHQTGQTRIGVVAPLVMRYSVLEDEQTVFVTVPPVLLARPARG